MSGKKQFSVVMSYDVQKTFIVEAKDEDEAYDIAYNGCLLYTSPSPRDATLSRMPSSA